MGIEVQGSMRKMRCLDSRSLGEGTVEGGSVVEAMSSYVDST